MKTITTSYFTSSLLNRFSFNLKIVLLPFAIFIASGVMAQTQSVISAAGGVNQSESISLEWSLGEMAVESINNKGLYTQGFHQPILLVKRLTPVIPVFSSPAYVFSIAPNPVVSELNVSIDNKLTSKVFVKLTDAFGRTVSSVSPSYNRAFKFSLRNQPSGTYYLFIYDESERLLKSFSVIKAN